MAASAVEAVGSLVYDVDRDGVIVSITGDWDRFARENEAPELTADAVRGRPLADFVADPPTWQLLEELLHRVRATRTPARYEFRCDAPGRRRFMRMEIRPIAEGALSLESTVLRTETRPHMQVLARDAVRSEEHIRMCSWCKRVHWWRDWVDVEHYLFESGVMESDTLPRISHGMCPSCEGDLLTTLYRLPSPPSGS